VTAFVVAVPEPSHRLYGTLAPQTPAADARLVSSGSEQGKWLTSGGTCPCSSPRCLA